MFKTKFTSNGVAGHLKTPLTNFWSVFTFIRQYVARDPKTILKFGVFKKLDFPQNFYLYTINAVLEIQPMSFWKLSEPIRARCENNNCFFSSKCRLLNAGSSFDNIVKLLLPKVRTVLREIQKIFLQLCLFQKESSKLSSVDVGSSFDSPLDIISPKVLKRFA